MQVFLRTRKAASDAEQSTHEVFAQIPRVGDFLARSHSTPLCLVTHVVWLAERADTLAQVEIYAVEVDRARALANAQVRSDVSGSAPF